MLDSNTILGINQNLCCSEYNHAILIQNWEGWPCGVPVVYPSNADLSKKGEVVRVSALFPPSQISAGIERCNAYAQIIKQVDVRPLCGNHKVMTIGEFDPSKFERLTEFIHDVGAISFILEHKEGRRNIAKGIHAIESMVKYSALFQHHRYSLPKLSGKDDSYVCIMTFLDLPYCIPLFNTRKVDGVGLSLAGATMEASEVMGQLNRAFTTDIIFSNYQDNAFVMDGVSVNRPSPIGNAMFRELEKMTTFELTIGPSVTKDEKKSKAKLPKKKLSTNDTQSVQLKWNTMGENVPQIAVPDDALVKAAPLEELMGTDPEEEEVVMASDSIPDSSSVSPLATSNNVKYFSTTYSWDQSDTDTSE